MEQAKIVARFTDGRVLKGYSSDFAPDRPRFHLALTRGPGEPAGASGDRAVEVPMPALKALFFVRDFAGDARYQEQKRFDELDGRQGRKVAVTFADGEVLIGYTVAYDPRRPGFFLYPADPRSNNLRVFAVARAVRAVASPPESEVAALSRDDARRAMVDAKLIGNLQSVVWVLKQTVSDWEGLIRAVETLTQDNASLRARVEDLERGERELAQLRQQRTDDLRALVQLRSAHRSLTREHEETARELAAIRRAYEAILREREAAAGELEALLRRLQPS
jgi:hypothetical protein